MKRKIRVAFVYHPCKSLTNTYHFTTGYNFFMNALKRNKQIDISFIKSENIFDVKTINKNFDIVLLYENANTGDTCVPETFTNIEKLYGLKESQVVRLMRSNLKTGSYRAWRKRVHEFGTRREFYK